MSRSVLEQLNPLREGGLSFGETAKAGMIVLRWNAKEGIEILLVHRLKQDDWSFPKGHVEPVPMRNLMRIEPFVDKIQNDDCVNCRR